MACSKYTVPAERNKNCELDENGFVKGDGSSSIADGQCVATPNGLLCPDNTPCKVWELSKNDLDSCMIDDVVEESLNIGAADVNVFKLLGIHEQNKLIDETGAGEALSSGYIPNYPASNAFDVYDTEWRSQQFGQDVEKFAYLGYDFGPIKLDNGRNRYGIKTYIKKNVTTLRIKQGCKPENRVTSARLERSVNGDKWFGAGIVNLPDCDGLVAVSIKSSVPSRYWRLRPIKFNGGENDYWSVRALQMSEYQRTEVDNIQDKVFMENRDRDYDEQPRQIKGSFVPYEGDSFQSTWGMALGLNGERYTIEVSFSQVVRTLGRPFVAGDIIELPSEIQYATDLSPVKKYLEIIDTGWSAGGFTANWKPTIQKVAAAPAFSSQETQDIMGTLERAEDDMGLFNINNGQNDKKYQDQHDITQNIDAEANTQVPQHGQDSAKIKKLPEEYKELEEKYKDAGYDANFTKVDKDRRSPYGIDALPPNGEEYTEGDKFPSSPKDGEYHRKTYTDVAPDIPPRLYRYSSAKSRWIFLESDSRFKIRNSNQVLQDFLDTENDSDDTISVPTDNIDNNLK